MEFLDHKALISKPKGLWAQENKKYTLTKMSKTLFGLCRDPKSFYPLIHLLRGALQSFFPIIILVYFFPSKRFLFLVLAWNKARFSELESKNMATTPA